MKNIFCQCAGKWEKLMIEKCFEEAQGKGIKYIRTSVNFIPHCKNRLVRFFRTVLFCLLPKTALGKYSSYLDWISSLHKRTILMELFFRFFHFSLFTFFSFIGLTLWGNILPHRLLQWIRPLRISDHPPRTQVLHLTPQPLHPLILYPLPQVMRSRRLNVRILPKIHLHLQFYKKLSRRPKLKKSPL